MIQRKSTVSESKQVARAQKQFEAWRRKRKKGSRIPEELWESAVLSAREVGVNQTSRALKLDYYDLKNRVLASPGGRSLETSGFLEFASSAATFLTEWAVEMENGRGSRIRIGARGPSGPDVVGLCRAFLGKES
jgi:hypothetical protein